MTVTPETMVVPRAARQPGGQRAGNGRRKARSVESLVRVPCGADGCGTVDDSGQVLAE